MYDGRQGVTCRGRAGTLAWLIGRRRAVCHTFTMGSGMAGVGPRVAEALGEVIG